MLKNKENRSLPPFVLADFADGSWHAASFAMSFLWEKEHPFYILQTFKNPECGLFMPRRLSHKLKEITLHELQQLKHKLINNYKIEKKKVKTLSIEGSLNKVLHYDPKLKKNYNVVIGTYSLFVHSTSMQLRCLGKIVNTSKHPLFIVPDEFGSTKNKELLFVVNLSKMPSNQLVEKIMNICHTTNSELEMLLVVNKKSQEIGREVKEKYTRLFPDIKVTVNQIAHSSKHKGIKQHLKHKPYDLLIIDNE